MRYSTRLFNFISPLPLDPHVACSRSRSLAPSDRSQGYNCFFFFIQRPARQTHWHLGQSPVENRAIIRPLTRASFHLLRSNTALSGPPSFVSRSRVPASVRSTAPCPLSVRMGGPIRQFPTLSMDRYGRRYEESRGRSAGTTRDTQRSLDTHS